MTLPLFPHEDAPRTRAIIERLHAAADMHWSNFDLQRFKHRPVHSLLSAMLSARSTTEDTRDAMRHLFALGDTPEAIARLTYDQVYEAIKGVTYPENKAYYVLGIARKLVENGGEVPRSVSELVQFPGVGWKAALLTLWVAYRLAPEICVDVHVARIGKRLGLVRPATTDPQKVSRELMDIVPRELWGAWNPTMVHFGKTTCFPSDPACDRCPIADLCPRIGLDD